jgi:hypothetical protein
MPEPKSMPLSKSAAQNKRKLLKGIAQAVEAHAALDTHMKRMGSLSQEAALAVAEHHAAVTDLLKRVSSAPPGKQAAAEMRRLQTAFNSKHLRLQSQMQRENSHYTAVSNVLKTRHDTVKNAIGNIK